MNYIEKAHKGAGPQDLESEGVSPSTNDSTSQLIAGSSQLPSSNDATDQIMTQLEEEEMSYDGSTYQLITKSSQLQDKEGEPCSESSQAPEETGTPPENSLHQLISDSESSQLEDEPSNNGSTNQVTTRVSELGPGSNIEAPEETRTPPENSSHQLITQLEDKPSSNGSTNQVTTKVSELGPGSNIESLQAPEETGTPPENSSHQLITESSRGDSTNRVITKVSEIGSGSQVSTKPPPDNSACHQLITECSQLGRDEGGDGSTNQVITEVSELGPGSQVTTNKPDNSAGHQLITDSSQLEHKGTEPPSNAYQVITESSQLQPDEVELSPSDSTEHQVQPRRARERSTSDHFLASKHQCPWHYWLLWSLVVVVCASFCYTSNSILGEQHVGDMCRRMVSEDLANERRALEERMSNIEDLANQIRALAERTGNIEKDLKDTTGQQVALEEMVNNVAELVFNKSTGLEERVSDTEWHLEVLNRKAAANELDVESLRHDLKKDTDLRLADLEVKVENSKEDSRSLDDKIQGLEMTVEQLNIDIAELKSGFTKYIDDTINKVMKYFFPQKLYKQ